MRGAHDVYTHLGNAAFHTARVPTQAIEKKREPDDVVEQKTSSALIARRRSLFCIMDVAPTTSAAAPVAPLLASVPAGGASTGRLHFAAGVGNRLFVLPLAEAGGASGGDPPAVTTVQW